MKTLTLVNGLPRAGKDTFADYLVQHHGYTKMSFADELKDIICRTLDISREELDDYKNEGVDLCVNNGGRFESLLSFRSLLQRFGTEGMKPSFGDSIWADLLYKRVLDSQATNIVVPDFRFLCEYQHLPDVTVNTVLIKDARDLPLVGHASDVELYTNNFKFDHTVHNYKDSTFFDAIEHYLETTKKD